MALPRLRTDRRPATRLAAALALLALAACGGDSPTTPLERAPGYDPHGAAIDESGAQRRFLYHWPVGTMIRVFVDPAAAPAGSDLRAAVLAAASGWSGTLRGHEAAITLVADPAQADVVLHYGEAARIVGTADCAPPAPEVGVTFACPDFAAGRFAVLPLLAGGPGHVKMDVAVYRGLATDESQFRRVVAHEIGHVLGIGSHSASATDLMHAAPAVAVPSAADGQTLRWLLQQDADIEP